MLGERAKKIHINQKEKKSVRKTVNLLTFHRVAATATVTFTAFVYFGGTVATARVRSVNGLTVLEVQNQQSSLDFVNAKPLSLPINPLPPSTTQEMIQALLSQRELGARGHAEGGMGTGIEHPVFLGTPAAPKPKRIAARERSRATGLWDIQHSIQHSQSRSVLSCDQQSIPI